MILLHLIIGVIYVSVFLAYAHNNKQDKQLWEYIPGNWNQEDKPTGNLTSFSIFILIAAISTGPLMVLATLAYKITNFLIKTKTKNK